MYDPARWDERTRRDRRERPVSEGVPSLSTSGRGAIAYRALVPGYMQGLWQPRRTRARLEISRGQANKHLQSRSSPKLDPTISSIRCLHTDRPRATANHAPSTQSAVCRWPQSVSTRCRRGSQAKRVSLLFPRAITSQWLVEGDEAQADDDDSSSACNHATQPVHRDTIRSHNCAALESSRRACPRASRSPDTRLPIRQPVPTPTRPRLPCTACR